MRYMHNGYPMQQRPEAIGQFTHLFAAEQFDRIIELGTGLGGFSLFLSAAAQLTTYDVRNKLSSDLAMALKNREAQRHILDIFDPVHTAVIKYSIQSAGRVLLLCDNGNKIKEFNEFAPSLKQGDVIMAHDYWRTQGDYTPNWFEGNEIRYADIEKCCIDNGLVDFHREAMEIVCWGSFIKDCNEGVNS